MNSRSPLQTNVPPKPSFTPTKPGLLQRKCACGKSAHLTDWCSECQNQLMLQRWSTHKATVDEAPAIVHEVLNMPGQTLDPTVQTLMESHLGHDFSQVRVHINAKASESAEAVNAHAYTVGKNIVFGTGQYVPQTDAGRRLLAHELSHVVQQRYLTAVPRSLKIGDASGTAEQEADAMAARIDRTPSPIGIRSMRSSFPVGVIAQPQLQRDLAIAPAVKNPIERGLSEQDIQVAIRFNQSQFRHRASLRIIRDVIGIAKEPAVSDRALAEGVARWQAMHGLAQDGMLGAVTVAYVIEELQAEGNDADAIQLMSEFPKGTFLDVDTSFCDCRQVLEREIQQSQLFIAEYQACGNDLTNQTAAQIEQCVDDRAKRRGKPLKTLGTTSPAGAIQVASSKGKCGSLVDRITLAHEQIHAVHMRELQQQHGQDTQLFAQAFNSASDRVTNEVEARKTDRAMAVWALSILDRICP